VATVVATAALVGYDLRLAMLVPFFFFLFCFGKAWRLHQERRLAGWVDWR